MSIGHIAVRPHSRAQGHLAAAAVAYRCGLALTCSRTGERCDFTRRAQRADVADYGLSGGRFESPAAFATAIESAEKRRNSRICRDVQVALPAELDEPSRIELARAFASEIAERYGTAACWAVHRPDRRSDQRNHHAHILLPTRALAADGYTFGKKLRVLDDQRRGPEEITAIRQLWEARANEALIAAGQEATVHTGRTTDPEPTLGTTHTAIERNAWKRRHARQRQRPMSAAQLVVNDGVCVTRRGRVLARHVALRAVKRYFVGEDTLSRSSPALAPVAAQGFASAVVAVESEPDPRPIRPPAPVVARDLADAVVAVVPEPEPRPSGHVPLWSPGTSPTPWLRWCPSRSRVRSGHVPLWSPGTSPAPWLRLCPSRSRVRLARPACTPSSRSSVSSGKNGRPPESAKNSHPRRRSFKRRGTISVAASPAGAMVTRYATPLIPSPGSGSPQTSPSPNSIQNGTRSARPCPRPSARSNHAPRPGTTATGSDPSLTHGTPAPAARRMAPSRPPRSLTKPSTASPESITAATPTPATAGQEGWGARSSKRRKLRSGRGGRSGRASSSA